MRAAVVSFFASANLGDLLIGQALVDLVTPYATAVPLAYRSDPLAHTDINALPVVPQRGSSLKGAILANPLVQATLAARTSFADAVLEQVAETDLLVIGGGNMLFDTNRWSRSAAEFAAIVDGTRQLGKPVFAISLGIGPFTTAAQHRAATAALAACDRVSFRDQRSLDLFRDHHPDRPAALSVDPVLRLGMLLGDRDPHVIAFNALDVRLNGASEAEYQRTLEVMVARITRLEAEFGLPVELFSTERADSPALDDLAERCPQARIVPIGGLDDLLQLYRRAGLVVACRMHSLIVAYTQGLPVVGMSWQPKVDAFFDIIGEPDAVLGITDPDRDGRLLAACRARLDEDETQRAERAQRLAGIRERGRVDEQILAELTAR